MCATLSCANSGVYGIIRSLHALARNGMAPQKLGKLNQYAVPQNAGIVTLIAIWALLLMSYFFGKSNLYIGLLLVSGFTGAIAWISLCWAQINFRRRLVKAGYTTADLRYQTPGSPYTGITAIILMMACLFFLAFNHDANYRIAFWIGLAMTIIPMLIYKIFGLSHIRHSLSQQDQMQFSKLFPTKD